MNKNLNTIPEIIEDIKLGKMVIILDDENRENEGDFVMAAEMATAEAINFMTIYGRGLICAPINESLAQKLNLQSMVHSNTSNHETAFTVSIDAREGITTGISASDRAQTLKLMTDENSTAFDFSKPGHIFPLIAKKGGVLSRRGHTEAAVDLALLSDLKPVGVICEILNPDGEMARSADLIQLARKHHLKISTIDALVQYLSHQKIDDSKSNLKEDTQFKKQKLEISTGVKEISRVQLPTAYGDFQLSLFKSETIPTEEHLALHLGLDLVLNTDVHRAFENPQASSQISSQSSSQGSSQILVRIHSECLTGDVFKSLRCDCGEQLDQAMKEISEIGYGLIIYLKQEGRGIGLSEKLRAYALQETGLDTVEANIKLGYKADLRNYKFAGQILNFFNLKNKKINLLTNNPEKISALQKLDFNVERKSILIPSNSYNEKYQSTKMNKLGHLLKG